VHSALWNYDLLAAPQYGRTCGSDPDRDTALNRSMSSGTTTASPPWCGRTAQPDPISTTPENEAQTDQTFECGAIFTNVQH
jgi:hypothetical protein